jgi:hypothetical protein
MPDKSLLLIALGVALITTTLSLHGLLRGFGQGAGVALVLVGVVTMSARRRKRKDADGMWLPSRDEERR